MSKWGASNLATPPLSPCKGRHKTQNPPARIPSGGGLKLTGFGLSSAALRARRRTRNDANNSYESREFLANLQHGANLQAGENDVNGPGGLNIDK